MRRAPWSFFREAANDAGGTADRTARTLQEQKDWMRYLFQVPELGSKLVVVEKLIHLGVREGLFLRVRARSRILKPLRVAR
jgi:hypothetical protein